MDNLCGFQRFGFESYLISENTEWRLVRMSSGIVIKHIRNDFVHLSVKQAQRNIHGTRILAQAAVDTTAGHVNGPDQMEDRYIRWQFTWLDQIGVLQAAFLAKTDRTDIPASITFDAFLEFIHPAAQPLLLIKG